MPPAIPQYLRTFRKRAGLTQTEMASLVGLHTAENVSRYEHLTRRPSLDTTFAFQLIFGVPAQDLFPGLYREVEQGVRARAQRILRQHESISQPPGARKWALIESLATAGSESSLYER